MIAHGSQYGGPLKEIAPDYPDAAFAGNAADNFGLDNVPAYVRSDEAGFIQPSLLRSTSRA